MYDYSKLLGLMREKNISQEELSHKLKINPCTFNVKVNNKNDFRQQEISKIINVLGIPKKEIAEYFFTHKL